jgi:hypothetical protein
MLLIQELIHFSHDHIGTLEFEYSKIASSFWPWYWKQEQLPMALYFNFTKKLTF